MNEKYVSWLINNYKNNNCPIGDLARDIIEDRKQNGIHIQTYKRMKKRMENLNACNNALNALDNSYTKFQEINKK